MQNMNRPRTQINQGALCGTGSVVGTILHRIAHLEVKTVEDTPVLGKGVLPIMLII